MKLEERLQKAETNGYTPIKIENENAFFFVEKNKDIEVGSIVKDSLERAFKIVFVATNGRMVGKPINP